MPLTTPENLDALANALDSLGAKLRLDDGSTIDVPIDRVSLAQYELSTWRTDAGDIDVIRGIPRANGLKDLRFYTELAEAGERLDVFGASIVVASLEMIIESKEGSEPTDTSCWGKRRSAPRRVARTPVLFAGESVDTGGRELLVKPAQG